MLEDDHRDESADLSATSDADLVLRTRSGNSRAFGELWRRHYRSGLTVARSSTSSLDPDDLVQEAYARIFQSIQKGGGPTGSFRAYLFTSIRNTAAAWGRARRETAIDEMDAVEDPESSEQATSEALDRSLTHQAFRSLPARWQEVLWYSEIEQMKPAEIAPLLGIKATAVAQLTFRAREGLREAWIQAHLRSVEQGSACQWAIERLGAYARHNLGTRDHGKLERHLTDCARCTIVASEAKEVSGRLALVLLPLTIGIGGAAAYLTSLHAGGVATVALAAMPSSVVQGAVVADPGTVIGAASGAGHASVVGSSAGGSAAGGTSAGSGTAGGTTAGAAGGTAAAGGAAGAVGAGATVGAVGAVAGVAGTAAAAGGVFSGIGAVTAAVAAGLVVAGGIVTAAMVLPTVLSHPTAIEAEASDGAASAGETIAVAPVPAPSPGDLPAPAPSIPVPTPPSSESVEETTTPSIAAPAPVAPIAPVVPVIPTPPVPPVKEPIDPGTGPGADPGTDPETDPGTEPGSDPGTDPGTNPGTDPGTNPGTDPGTNPGTEPGTDPALPAGTPRISSSGVKVELRTGIFTFSYDLTGASNATAEARTSQTLRATATFDEGGKTTLTFSLRLRELLQLLNDDLTIRYVAGGKSGEVLETPLRDALFSAAPAFNAAPALNGVPPVDLVPATDVSVPTEPAGAVAQTERADTTTPPELTDAAAQETPPGVEPESAPPEQTPPPDPQTDASTQDNSEMALATDLAVADPAPSGQEPPADAVVAAP